MSEAIRHSASSRSDRKMRHQIEVLCEALEHLLIEHEARGVNIRYAYSKARKLQNRLSAKDGGESGR